MIEASTSNPFSTRFFAPGVIRYKFPKPLSSQALIDRIIHSRRRRTAIVGPHGSGKSTLMTELFHHPGLRSAFPNPRWVRIPSNHTRWKHWTNCVRSVPQSSILLIDGYEQLGWVMQWLTRASAASRRTLLLVSAHAPPKHFEEVWRTYIDPDIEHYVVSHVIAQNPHLNLELVIQSEAWSESRARHGQNLRESLFDMYDWYRDQVDGQKRQR